MPESFSLLKHHVKESFDLKITFNEAVASLPMKLTSNKKFRSFKNRDIQASAIFQKLKYKRKNVKGKHNFGKEYA